MFIFYKKIPKEQRYGFVYIWRDKGKNRWYIGAHWGSEDDGYICSSTWMCNSYNRRPQDFKRRVVFRTLSKKDLWNKEYNFLCCIKQQNLGKKYYNFTIQRNELKGNHIVSDITKQRISDVLKGKKKNVVNKRITLSEEHKERISVSHLGKKKTDDHVRKIMDSKRKNGTIIPTKENRLKMVETKRKNGTIKHNQTTKDNISKALKGRHLNPNTEFKRKISDEDVININKLYNEGMKMKHIAKIYNVISQTISKYIIKL